MGSLFGRKGRNETHGRRGSVGKKSAAMLAAVAVAGGSVTVGVPEAEALPKIRYIYWEKIDQDGNPLEGSTFELSLAGETREWANEVGAHRPSYFLGDTPMSFVVTDNESAPEIEDLYNPREAYWNPFYDFQVTDLDPRPGHFLIVNPLDEYGVIYNVEDGYRHPEHLQGNGPFGRSHYRLSEIENPSGYTNCDGQDDLEFKIGIGAGGFDTEALGDGTFRHTLKENPFIEVVEGTGQGWTEVTDRNFHGALRNYNDYFGVAPEDSANFSVDDLYRVMSRPSTEEWVDDKEVAAPKYVNALTGDDLEHDFVHPIHSVGALPNCRVEGLPSVTTTVTNAPSTVVTTTTQPPVTSTLPDTTVTNPPVTVTNPGTTVTRPDTTITQPPVVSTIPGTTITKPGATVTQPAKTLVTTLPGTTVREPGTTVREPATTVREPGETVATTLREPDMTVIPAPVTVEKEKPVVVEVEETVTPDVVPSEEPAVAEENTSTPPTTEVDATPAPESTTTNPVPVEADNRPTSRTMQVLATTGANSSALAGLAVLLSALAAVAAVARRRRAV